MNPASAMELVLADATQDVAAGLPGYRPTTMGHPQQDQGGGRADARRSQRR